MGFAIDLPTGLLARLRQGGIATLVAGDFNVWSKDDSDLEPFRRHHLQSPAWTGETTRGACAPDHLFFAAAADASVRLVRGSFHRIERRYYSDHHGLNVRVMTAR